MSLDKATANISIHAPTRGATYVAAVRSIPGKISIHAPTRGATRKPDNNSNNSKFQSTLPRGERPDLEFGEMFSADFNPRSHEGSDRRYHRPERDPLFQSTLPRGERHGSSQFSGMPVVISIHAPTRGATHGSANQYKSNLIFQSTLPRGERQR